MEVDDGPVYGPLAPADDPAYAQYQYRMANRAARQSYRRRRKSSSRRYRYGYRSYRTLRPRRYYYRGRGAYYLKARGNLSGNVGLGKFDFGAEGGISKGSIVTGLGSYDERAIIKNSMISPMVPEIRNTIYAEGGTIIRHREYLGTVVTSNVAGAFKMENYALNPAQEGTFPWLSTIAKNYEEYVPNGIFFEFRSTCSDAIASSTNLALGQLMMATQYDPTDPPFNNDQEMLNYSWAQSGKVSEHVRHYVECDPRQTPLSHLYTREGEAASDSDLRFSDFGTFSIATQGLQGTSINIGQLWVSYEFIFYKPKVGSAGADAGGLFKAIQTDSAISAIYPFGSDLSVVHYDVHNNIGCTLSLAANAIVITFPVVRKPVTYILTYTVEGASTASVQTPTYAFSSLIQPVQCLPGPGDTEIALPPATSTTSEVLLTVFLDVNNVVDPTPQTVSIQCGAPPTSAVAGIYVTEIPYLDPALYP